MNTNTVQSKMVEDAKQINRLARKKRSLNRVTSFGLILLLFFDFLCIQPAQSYSAPSTYSKKADVSRSSFFQKSASTTIATLVGVSGTRVTTPMPSIAIETLEEKQKNLSDEEVKKIVTADVVERSFLVSADLTRSIYDESSIFTDEIDSYTIEKWVKGTKALFVAEGSRVNLVGDVEVTPEKVEFRFDEDLMFRIPFRPVVSLTGRVVLTRDKNTGLITDYREFWDQSVASVLKTAKFNL